MTWYISDLARFRSEREAIEALAQEVNWLSLIGWRFDAQGRLVLDADLQVTDQIRSVSMTYPSYFPSTPPSVFPRGDETRWSDHQFGAGGELCLEHRPDNWTPDKTGALVLRSAYNLLFGENPAPGERGIVTSAHETTLGQRMRSESRRVPLTIELQNFIKTVAEGTSVTGTCLFFFHEYGTVAFPNVFTLTDGQVWRDASLPERLDDASWVRPCTFARIAETDNWPTTKTLDEFKEACKALGIVTDANVVLIAQQEDLRAYHIHGTTVRRTGIIPFGFEKQRLDAGHQTLKNRGIAIVGAGSLGSKIAVSLARSGVGRFVLIDDDVLLPENLVRNNLDWRDVGMHKVDGVARQINLVSPSASIHVRRVQIAGQEASETADTALKTIGDCDLIIDATADANVLNLLSAIATEAKKPIVWAEVFGGGIGGLIARYRPGAEPLPHYMRLAIENWFEERDATPVRATKRYELDRDGVPLIADDADVSAIAAHATRFAIDTLLGRDPSIFPHSIYVIGLAPGSVIAEPFQAFPIALSDAPREEAKPTLSAAEVAEEVARVVALFVKK